jgi:acyl dehydratase
MNMEMPFAVKEFDTADQEIFARDSGDRNPVHLDREAARRTLAGSTVVHGVHALLWSLDGVIPQLPPGTILQEVRVEFKNWIYVGSVVSANLTNIAENTANICLKVGQVTVTSVFIRFDDSIAPDLDRASTSWEVAPISTEPADPDSAELLECGGVVGFASAPERLAAAWPRLAQNISPAGIAAIIASSTLVGMECPGRYSIYKELILNFCHNEPSSNGTGLSYRVQRYDERFRLITLRVEGVVDGYKLLEGTIKAIASLPPFQQPSIYKLMEQICPDQFNQTCSLIIGGSRGLGELTAKALAAGGGKVIVTYALGRADAERVSREIQTAGGTCKILRYDVTRSAALQLAHLNDDITHVYYYATPRIVQPKIPLFLEARFSVFVEFYLKGFSDLCGFLRLQRRRSVRIFYPSTVFVETRPSDMTEYAMSKAAGEILCADINRFLGGVEVLVRRLPRLETDQTVSIIPTRKADSISVILPILKEMCMTDIKAV